MSEDYAKELHGMAYSAEEQGHTEAAEILRSAAEELEQFRAALQPFAAFASAAERIVDNPDALLAPVAKHGEQTLCIAAFKNASYVFFQNLQPTFMGVSSHVEFPSEKGNSDEG